MKLYWFRCLTIFFSSGLAGVYHIAEHYEHEAKRGIEFISNMARAMYGPEHFARLSPTLLVAELPDKIKLVTCYGSVSTGMSQSILLNIFLIKNNSFNLNQFNL